MICSDSVKSAIEMLIGICFEPVDCFDSMEMFARLMLPTCEHGLSLHLFVFFNFFLGLHPQHMEVPRLEVESELPVPAYTVAHGNAGSSTH